jgi:hypothetical protein
MKALPFLILLAACNQVFGLEEPVEADAGRIDAISDAQLDAPVDAISDAAIDAPTDACMQYVLQTQGQSWDAASSDCSAQGRYLVRIDSLSENNTVRLLSATPIHIGLRRVNGNFVWEDGTSPSFTNWAPAQPSGEECTVMAVDGSWFDVDCTSVNSYVCECGA